MRDSTSVDGESDVGDPEFYWRQGGEAIEVLSGDEVAESDDEEWLGQKGELFGGDSDDEAGLANEGERQAGADYGEMRHCNTNMRRGCPGTQTIEAKEVCHDVAKEDHSQAA